MKGARSIAGRIRSAAATGLAFVMVAGFAFAQSQTSRARFSVPGFSSADALTATGWTSDGSYASTALNVALAVNKALYLNAGHTIGISNDDTNINFLGGASITPNTDQNLNVGSTSKRWSTLYIQDIQKILGTGTGYSQPQGTIATNTTAVGNVGASGPDVLQTFTLPASSVVVTGRGFRAHAWGTTANNANAKTVSLKFGSATLITKQLTASIAGRWDIEATCIRTGASGQDCYATATNSGGTTVAATDGATVMRFTAFAAQTQTETNTLDVATGSTVSTNDNDIVSEGLVIEGL